MRDAPSVVALVARTAESDQGGWSELVERYAPMVWSIGTRYRLSSHDIEDVGQNVAAACRTARVFARARSAAQRARCLQRLRRSSSLASFMDSENAGTPLKSPGGEPDA